jgi:FAD:protein FMN transferase
MRWSRNVAAAFTLAFAFQLAAQTASTNPPVHKQKYAMGTVFEIVAYDNRDMRAASAIDEAFLAIARLDDVMSNYKPESELIRLNRSAHFHAQTVTPDLFRVIEQSLEYSRLSAGEFDISVGPLVDLWKAQQRGERAVTPEAEKKTRECVGFEKIELLPANRIEFHSPCLRIDVGGIGKGYAVDRAASILRSRGILSALINAGGSTLYAIGAPPGQTGWSVRLRDPSGKLRPEVLLKDNSISTSEQTAPSLLGNSSAGHVIDPASGQPLRSSAAVSVVAETATASDALSTTMLLVGPARGKELISLLPQTAAVWLSADGHVESGFNGVPISTAMEEWDMNGKTSLKGSSPR